MLLLFTYPQDYKTGFGGQFGVQKDRVDASAAGWDHVEKVPKHPSQQGRIQVHVETEAPIIGYIDKRVISKTTFLTTPELFIGLIQAIWCKNEHI